MNQKLDIKFEIIPITSTSKQICSSHTHKLKHLYIYIFLIHTLVQFTRLEKYTKVLIEHFKSNHTTDPHSQKVKTVASCTTRHLSKFDTISFRADSTITCLFILYYYVQYCKWLGWYKHAKQNCIHNSGRSKLHYTKICTSDYISLRFLFMVLL